MEKNEPIYKNIKTRFAPSPTGDLHIGSARTALFNFLAAKKYGGELYLRIEDTDKERSLGEYERSILDGLSWLNIPHTGTIVRQSVRGEIYEKYITQLLKEGAAYESHEERNGEENTVIRFKNPNKEVVFQDIVRGEIKTRTDDLGDFVIARDKRTPLYHLAVVVDDYEMGITHVIRGEDHISNTPRQILIADALGAERPLYAHLPLVLGKDRSKLSKRHGATGITEFRAQGYLPEALVNFMALLGWSPDEEERQRRNDIFSISELASHFSLSEIGKGGAVFDYDKLRWINRQYIRALGNEEWKEKVVERLPQSIASLPSCEKIVLALRDILDERIEIFGDIEVMYKKGELSYFFIPPEYSAEELLPKGEGSLEETKHHLQRISAFLKEVPKDSFSHQSIKDAIWDYADKEGRGAVLWPMRYALSGVKRSPDPFVLSEFFGKEETLERLKTAIKKIDDVFL